MPEHTELERLARTLLQWKYGQTYAGESLVQQAAGNDANARAVDCVDMASTLLSQQAGDLSGTPVTLKKNGVPYRRIGPCKHKEGGREWKDTVLYRNAAGEWFTREEGDFAQEFREDKDPTNPRP